MEFLPRTLRLKLAASPMLQKLVSNTGWLLVDRLVRLLGGLVVGVWLARYLGPEQYGLYNYAIAFVGIFSSLTSLGLDSIVVRDLVRYPDQQPEILGTTLGLKLLGGVLLIAFSLGTILLYRPHDSLSHWLVGITAASSLFQAFDAIDFWFQSQVQSKYAIYAKNSTFILLLLIKAVLIQAQAPLIAFAWVSLAEVGLGSLGLVISYQLHHHAPPAWRFSWRRARALMADSWSLMLAGLAIYIQARIDQVMIGEMLGDADVGQYSVAMRLIELFAFIPMIIQSSAAPVITLAKADSEAVYYDKLLQLYRLMMLCFLLTAIPIFLCSQVLVTRLYGEAYRSAGILLALFSIRLFFTNFGVAKSLFITNENLFRYSLMTAIAGSITNIVLNLWLIPQYGAAGAIGATICSFLVTTFLLDWFYPRVRQNLYIMLRAIVTPWKLTLLSP